MNGKANGLMIVPKPLRFAYLLRMYPRFTQTFVVNEIRELERQGLNPSIVSLRKPDEGLFHEAVTRVKTKAHYLPETLWDDGFKNLTSLWSQFRRSPRDYWRALRFALGRSVTFFEVIQAGHVLRWARKRKIDHVHVHFGTSEATVAWLAHRMGGLSYSLTLHAFDIFRDTVDRELLARKINASRFTVTVCESNRNYLLEHIPGVLPAKVRVNYNGIDLERFTPGSGGRDDWSLFSVGRLIEKKGFLYLVEAVHRLREQGLPIKCAIAGEGPEEMALRTQIERLGLSSNVRLVGSLSEEQVREHMQRCACFVLPCVRAKDGNVDALPTVLLEAMACGCPVVSTRLSGVPEIIEDGFCGFLSQPEDANGLADAIHRIVTNGPLAAEMGKNARARVEERFDITRNVGLMAGWLLAPGISSSEASIAEPTNEMIDGHRAELNVV